MPGSNSHAGAPSLSLTGGTDTFDLAGTSTEAGEYDPVGNGQTVWWKITPLTDTYFRFDTSATPGDPDTYIAVFTGTGFASSDSDFEDDDSGQDPLVGSPYYGAARIEFLAVGGTTYYVQVTAYDLNVSGVLTWKPGAYGDWITPDPVTVNVTVAYGFGSGQGTAHWAADYEAIANFYETGVHPPQRESAALSCMWTHVTNGENGGYGSFGAGPGILDGCPALSAPNVSPGDAVGSFTVGERESWSAGFFSSDTMTTTYEEAVQCFPLGDYLKSTTNVPGVYDDMLYQYEMPYTDQYGRQRPLRTFQHATIDYAADLVDNLAYQAFSFDVYVESGSLATPFSWWKPSDVSGSPVWSAHYAASAGIDPSPSYDSPATVTTVLGADYTLCLRLVTNRLTGSYPTLIGAASGSGYEASIVLVQANKQISATFQPSRYRIVTFDGEVPTTGEADGWHVGVVAW